MIEKNFTEPPETDALQSKGLLRKPEALARLGIGEATLDRWASIKKIGSQLVPRPGKKAERCYSVDDVERELRVKEARAAKRPPSAQPTNGAGGEGKPETALTLRGPGLNAGTLREFMDEWLDHRNDVPLNQKLWLSLEEAAAYSGLAQATLLKLSQTGDVRAVKSGGWKISRQSLETWSGEAPFSDNGIE